MLIHPFNTEFVMKLIIFYSLLASMIIGNPSNKTSRNTPNADSIKTAASIQSTNKSWLGKWERRIWQNYASLEITGIRNDSIAFHLEASSGGHLGELEDTAVVKHNLAIFFTKDDPDTCLIRFNLSGDSVITVQKVKGFCGAGMGVTFNGEYKNVKYLPEKEPAETLKSLGVLKTAKADSIFRKLVGDDYTLFLNTTQLGHEEEDIDNLHTKVQVSAVRGMYTSMENIVMIDASDHIWAAVIDNNDNSVHYFTNVSAWKKRLPKTIDSWRERFKTYPVVYH